MTPARLTRLSSSRRRSRRRRSRATWRRRMRRESSSSRMPGFGLLLAAGARLRGVALPVVDGRDVPDTGGPAGRQRRREFQPRHDLAAAAAGTGAVGTWRARVVAASPLAVAAGDVGNDRVDRVADRVPARSRLRALDPAAGARLQHEHRHRSVGSRSPRRLYRPRPQRRASSSSMRCVAGSAAMRERFRPEVLAPFALAAAAACAVAFYQGFIDLAFLNRPFWTYMIRASGTLADPNKLGAVTAFWTIGAVVLARRMARPWPTVVTISALATRYRRRLVVRIAHGPRRGVGQRRDRRVEGFAHWRSTRSSTRIDVKRVLVMGAAAGVLAVAMIVLLRGASTHTVIARGSWTLYPVLRRQGDQGKRQRVVVGAIRIRPGGDRDDQGASDRWRWRRHVPRALVRLRQVARLHHSSGRQRAELVAPSPGRAWPRRQRSAAGVVLDRSER